MAEHDTETLMPAVILYTVVFRKGIVAEMSSPFLYESQEGSITKGFL